MSIPKNHHYISQTHISNFFNKQVAGIYLHDKERDKIFKSNGTRNIFSEKNLNTKRLPGGNVDYTSTEKELNENFEKDFNSHFQQIRKFMDSHKLSKELSLAFSYFARYGIIGEFRTPTYKKRLDDTIFNGMKDIMENAVDELKESFFKTFEFDDEVNYTNIGDFWELSQQILDTMGDLSFILQTPKEHGDYFILGDFVVATVRDKINEYFNPDVREIAYIGFPLSSKIYLNLYSNKWDRSPKASLIQVLGTSAVYGINRANYYYTKKYLACEDESYLQDFVRKVRSDLNNQGV